MADKVQLIKEEIERIIEEETPISKGSDYYHGAKESMEKLLQFIDSLPEEPKCIYNRAFDERKKFCKYCSAACDVRIEEEPTSEDLEEAAKHYLYGAILYDDVYVGNPTEEDCIRCFKAGAEWQKKKDQETIELAEDHAMLAGMMKEREEMMKDAVEVEVEGGSFIRGLGYKGELKKGDKVKIIIIKPEQQ